MNLKRVVYISTASKEFSRDGIYRLLRAAIRANQKNGVTGLLLHWEPQFLQILEGPADKVAETMQRIEADPRHHKIQVLGEQDTERRHFTDLGMGYLDFRPIHRRQDEASREIESAFDGTPRSGADLDRLLEQLVSLRSEVKNFSGAMV